ncbi:hypothetical protein SRS16P2_00469 (plasmid) [Variovorax sp. SRS16]|uniref:hypothetical protein n=1 Tax=Variovorax sp. SRS16 TaxID=282217 RepID=UPI0013178A24|nr:hypothetical protein [Variovorax sp. SRS16]VTU46071.1 hypothetical protein SRS16P2_00469 [Variovorax sp. SRS16]
MVPWYRAKSMPALIHMKGSKLPPSGEQLLLDGKTAVCLAASAYLRDGPVQDRPTCDRPLCEAHATQVGPNAHLCPRCRTEALDEIGQRNLFTHLVQS